MAFFTYYYLIRAGKSVFFKKNFFKIDVFHISSDKLAAILPRVIAFTKISLEDFSKGISSRNIHTYKKYQSLGRFWRRYGRGFKLPQLGCLRWSNYTLAFLWLKSYARMFHGYLSSTLQIGSSWYLETDWMALYISEKNEFLNGRQFVAYSLRLWWIQYALIKHIC